MSTPLLAEANQTQGQETAPEGAPAQKDTQAKPEQKQAAEAADAKPKDEKPAEKKADDKKAADEGAPELYEFEVPRGLPEGHALDEAVLDSFTDVARELNLSQPKAQKLLDKVIPTIHRRAQEQQAAIHEQWVEAVKNDKVIGGPKLDENLAVAKRGIKAANDPELTQLLNGPIGSHPAIVRLMFRFGQTVSQDKFVGSEKGQSVDLNDDSAMARKLYPKSAT